MGMTDRQFDVFLSMFTDQLKDALRFSPDNEKLKEMIAKFEKELTRP